VPRPVKAPTSELDPRGAEVNATVILPIYLQGVQFEPGMTNQEKQEKLAQLALKVLREHGTPEPIIHECSDEDLVE